VPLDTTENSDYLHNLAGKGIFNEFVTSYMDHNRDVVSKEYPDFGAFSRNFKVDDIILGRFIAYAEKNGVKHNARGLKISENFIKLEIRALIARQMFHNDGFFQIINQDNDILKKAIEALKGNTYEKMSLGD
jgi:carboxyl-terminal processing protease